MITLSSPQELLDHQGAELGVSGWQTLTESTLSAFRTSIRARTSASPTVVDADLVLALLSLLVRDVFVVERRRMAVNYGLERVRHLRPVQVGDRIRARCTLAQVDLVGEATVQATLAVRGEVEGTSAVVCEAEVVVRYVF